MEGESLAIRKTIPVIGQTNFRVLPPGLSLQIIRVMWTSSTNKRSDMLTYRGRSTMVSRTTILMYTKYSEPIPYSDTHGSKVRGVSLVTVHVSE